MYPKRNRVLVVIGVVVVSIMCVVGLSWRKNRRPVLDGKWYLDVESSRVLVPEGATDVPYIEFRSDGSLLYVVGGARLEALYEVAEDKVRVTPSSFDAPVFFGIDGSKVAPGRVLLWRLVTPTSLEWKQEGGNGMLFFVRE